MIQVLTDYMERLRSLHTGVESALAGLPDEALDWSPGPGMNSLSVLATHLAGAERFWIGDMVGQDPSGRVRDAEFASQGQSATALVELLAVTLEHSLGVLDVLRQEDLELVRESPVNGKRYSVAWCLHHALEHTALHLGHIQITRQLWDHSVGGSVG